MLRLLPSVLLLFIAACATSMVEEMPPDDCESCDIVLPTLSAYQPQLTSCTIAGSLVTCDSFETDIPFNVDEDSPHIFGRIWVKVAKGVETDQLDFESGGTIDLADYFWAPGSPVEIMVAGQISYADQFDGTKVLSYQAGEILDCEGDSCGPTTVQAPFAMWEVGLFPYDIEQVSSARLPFEIDEQDGRTNEIHRHYDFSRPVIDYLPVFDGSAGPRYVSSSKGAITLPEPGFYVYGDPADPIRPFTSRDSQL